MINFKKAIFILFIALSFGLGAANVHIFGEAKEYASNTIIFYKYSDRITFIKKQLFELEIDKEGKFDVNFEVDDITYVFAEFGIYHAYFYAEPDGSYELILPPFQEKSLSDIFNPFFSNETIQIGIKNMQPTDLNYLILDFDYYYFRYLDLKYIELYVNGLETDVDTFITEINSKFNNYNNKYFQDYKKYRIAALKNIATQKQYEDQIVYSYYTKAPVLYDNPAYMDLFNNIYAKYFDLLLVAPHGDSLYAIITYGHSISRLKKFLSRNLSLRNNQFQELVILKGLNDAFGGGNLQWLPLLLTLDSVHLSTQYPFHQDVAQNIADNVLSMAKGTIAPPFELPDTAGEMHSLKEFKNKYTYIQFANTKTYSCQLEFAMMGNLHKRYKEVCNFVTILTDSDIESAKAYINKNEFGWTFLFTEINSQTISTYKIDTYPTYFLVDTRGSLLMSPAPSPSENFEKYFFKYVEDKLPKK